MVPLFHACFVENPRVCGIRHAVHSVREEREVRKFNEILYLVFFPIGLAEKLPVCQKG